MKKTTKNFIQILYEMQHQKLQNKKQKCKKKIVTMRKRTQRMDKYSRGSYCFSKIQGLIKIPYSRAPQCKVFQGLFPRPKAKLMNLYRIS